MESDSILKMLSYSFCYYFSIDVIVSEDESTMRDVLKYPSRGA